MNASLAMTQSLTSMKYLMDQIPKAFEIDI